MLVVILMLAIMNMQSGIAAQSNVVVKTLSAAVTQRKKNLLATVLKALDLAVFTVAINR